MKFVGLYASGQSQEKPDTIIIVSSSEHSMLLDKIEEKNAMYDVQYGVEGNAEERIEYIIDGIEEEVPSCEVVVLTDKVYL